ncbi:MAG: NUDIX domain-containing protein [Chlorobium sp.]
MNFEPQKFFIGLIDFFSVLMPGAMLAYLGKDWAAAQFGLGNGFPLNSAETGAVFFFASYLLGHIVFLLSSSLDDLVYDQLRAGSEWKQISNRLAKGKTLSGKWLRRVSASSWLFGKNADTAVMQVQRIKARSLHKLEAEESINAFQWSKTRLTKELPEGLLAVNRFEADSKFFRSFVVVLGLLALFYAFQGRWWSVVCFVGMAPALWRYIDLRFKSTQQAYWFVITLEAMKAESPSRIVRSDGITHAGGVVFKGQGDGLEFLLVEASKERSQWVLPKGHIEPGETPRESAVREVREETGHWARVVSWITDDRLSGEQNAPLVQWFLMELVEEETEWPPENRQFTWLSLSEAKIKATFPETVVLLEKARSGIEKMNASAVPKR